MTVIKEDDASDCYCFGANWEELRASWEGLGASWEGLGANWEEAERASGARMEPKAQHQSGW